MTNNAGTTWQGIECAPGIRRLLEVTSDEMLAKLAVKKASLSSVVEQQQRSNLERQRAMLLCHVDEIEQELGYDDDPDKARTSQIRSFWKDSGRPKL